MKTVFGFDNLTGAINVSSPGLANSNINVFQCEIYRILTYLSRRMQGVVKLWNEMSNYNLLRNGMSTHLVKPPKISHLLKGCQILRYLLSSG